MKGRPSREPQRVPPGTQGETYDRPDNRLDSDSTGVTRLRTLPQQPQHFRIQTLHFNSLLLSLLLSPDDLVEPSPRGPHYRCGPGTRSVRDSARLGACVPGRTAPSKVAGGACPACGTHCTSTATQSSTGTLPRSRGISSHTTGASTIARTMWSPGRLASSQLRCRTVRGRRSVAGDVRGSVCGPGRRMGSSVIERSWIGQATSSDTSRPAV